MRINNWSCCNGKATSPAINSWYFHVCAAFASGGVGQDETPFPAGGASIRILLCWRSVPDGIPTRPERFFKIKNSGDEEWGNVFLTSEWNLYVDWTKQQHDAAMERLGIDHLSVIVSGSVRIVGGRTSVQVR